MSICLDVAYGANDCEAVVEEFYSVLKAHKKAGHQSNENHTYRTIVDWALPHPISAPATMKEIAKLYIRGDKTYQLNPHRSVRFFDPRNRSADKYITGKVIDRLQMEKPKCPHVIEEADC